MKQQIPTDLHTHSTLSFDAESEPREMVERAIELGIKVLASTEHIDANVFYKEKYRQSVLIPKAHDIIYDLKREYANDITLIYGVEFAQTVHDLQFTQKLLEEFSFDFIIGSVHAVRGEEDFYDIQYKKMSDDEIFRLFERYFDEVCEVVNWGGVDAIAHLTYPLRYITGREGIAYDIGRHDEKIEKVFRLMIENGIALEINTGGLRSEGYGKTDPHYCYLEKYRQMGGELITFGSDAHRARDLGKGIAEAVNTAREYGFENAAWFEKGTKHLIPII